jgi:transposase
MWPLSGEAKVFLVLGSTDMRKAINGLSQLVAGHQELDAFSGHLYVFCNRSRSIIKALFWDRNGFCLWQKRLERHRFHWPESAEEVLELGHRELCWLLDGLDPLAVRGHPRLRYSTLL